MSTKKRPITPSDFEAKTCRKKKTADKEKGDQTPQKESITDRLKIVTPKKKKIESNKIVIRIVRKDDKYIYKSKHYAIQKTDVVFALLFSMTMAEMTELYDGGLLSSFIRIAWKNDHNQIDTVILVPQEQSIADFKGKVVPATNRIAQPYAQGYDGINTVIIFQGIPSAPAANTAIEKIRDFAKIFEQCDLDIDGTVPSTYPAIYSYYDADNDEGYFTGYGLAYFWNYLQQIITRNNDAAANWIPPAQFPPDTANTKLTFKASGATCKALLEVFQAADIEVLKQHLPTEDIQDTECLS